MNKEAHLALLLNNPTNLAECLSRQLVDKDTLKKCVDLIYQEKDHDFSGISTVLLTESVLSQPQLDDSDLVKIYNYLDEIELSEEMAGLDIEIYRLYISLYAHPQFPKSLMLEHTEKALEEKDLQWISKILSSDLLKNDPIISRVFNHKLIGDILKDYQVSNFQVHYAWNELLRRLFILSNSAEDIEHKYLLIKKADLAHNHEYLTHLIVPILQNEVTPESVVRDIFTLPHYVLKQFESLWTNLVPKPFIDDNELLLRWNQDAKFKPDQYFFIINLARRNLSEPLVLKLFKTCAHDSAILNLILQRINLNADLSFKVSKINDLPADVKKSLFARLGL